MHDKIQNFQRKMWYYLMLIAAILQHVHGDDVAIMQELAKGLNITGWSDNNPCNWSGVHCDAPGKVTSINLISKSVTGQLTPNLNQLSSLQYLKLQRNQLSGPLPSLSNLTNLKEVYFDFNDFNSIPTDFLSGLTSLETFSISNNSNLPPWTIPTNLKDSIELVSLLANGANIIGPIPDIFGSFPSLQNVRLSYNNITGSLPQSFANSGIQNLWLNNQRQGFSGSIDVLGSMSQVTQVWLHVNHFSGAIPDLSGCKALYDLQLRDNDLTGVIPASLYSLSMLRNVSLQNNKFQGPIPTFPDGVQLNLGTTNNFCNNIPGPCDPQVTTLLQVAADLGYPLVLAQSWAGNDPCRSWKFISCDSGSVSVINFAKQKFSGTISPAIANLTSLRSLTLSDNNLFGPIPSSLTSLKILKLLDLTNNNISGKIPAFAPSVTVKTSNNPFIGIDLPPNSPPGSATKDGTLPSSPTNERKASKPRWVVPVVVFLAVIIAVVIGIVVYRRCAKILSGKGNGKRTQSLKIDTDLITKGAPSPGSSHFSDDTSGGPGGIPIDVLREVTDDFCQENILGEGGFGVVYKGVFRDGTHIAVKRMGYSAFSSKGLKEFKAEIEVLTNVKHKNLVSFFGFCVNGNERLLVYEYMPQGTLGQHLFNCQESCIPPLSWEQRIAIALDVARGIEYLHGLAQQTFIHRDIKPSNILLGDDLRAKVSDFGLVKNAPDGKHSIETKLAGTFGYLAPEYAATGKVTTKVDVFAYGAVLMEIITGEKALDDARPEEKVHLVTWFRKVIFNKEEMKSFVDPSLQSSDEETFKCICKVAELAAHCTARDPNQRPVMAHVVNVLSPLVEQWKPAAYEEETSGNNISVNLRDALHIWMSSNSENHSNSEIYLDGIARRSPHEDTRPHLA